MKNLLDNREYFEVLYKEFQEEIDVLADKPSVSIDVWDGFDYDTLYIDTEPYIRDYCPKIGGDIHLFTYKFHICYSPITQEIDIREIFHFNTSEYGVPSEYCRDELHDSDACVIIIKEDTFWFNDEEYSLGSTEEQKFQLSCTELGYYIDVIEFVRNFIIEDLEEHGNPKV